MKFVHLSDLHIGKRWAEYSLLEDQKDILEKILTVIDAEKPDAVIVAGDVYDKSVPSAEAVELFDDFIVQLANRKLQVFIISGNHDSAERIAFGGRIMDASGIHLSPVYNGRVEPTVLKDAFGKVGVYMLPFVKPAHVRRFYPDEKIESYEDAVRVAIGHMDVDKERRNVLVTHQFITGAERTESEERSVGGTDNVDAAVFKDFDYVALGHIHCPQNVGSRRIRYCGTPLKYSFSEKDQEKSVTVVELKGKEELTVRMVPLVPLHEVREIRGTYEELTARSFYLNTTYETDFLRIVLTDEEDVINAAGKLRAIYKNYLDIRYDNTRTRSQAEIGGAAAVETKQPIELCEEFYTLQNNAPMSKEQREFLSALIESIWEEEA